MKEHWHFLASVVAGGVCAAIHALYMGDSPYRYVTMVAAVFLGGVLGYYHQRKRLEKTRQARKAKKLDGTSFIRLEDIE